MGNWYLILTCMILFIPHLIRAEWMFPFNRQLDQVVDAAIISPIVGQSVQDSVVIRGSTTLDGFQAYEVYFASTSDPTQTWFLIQESTTPIQAGILAVWDTSTIIDGDYSLRLVVHQTNGDRVEAFVPDLHVRNYSPSEIDTPTPASPVMTLSQVLPTGMPSSSATSTSIAIQLLPTITPLPTNPAEISSSQAFLAFGKGAVFTIGFFALLGAYLGIRTILHDRK